MITEATGSQGPTPSAFVQSLLSRGGEIGRLIAEYDWSATSIGAIGTWSHSLRTAVGLLLRSPIPIVMLWNEDGVMLYNDAYSVFAGGRHPQLLGSKVREGWPEVADFNDNVMKIVLAGGTLAYQDQELTLHRHGSPEQVWMNLDYSPVPDDDGEVRGVIAILVETTERVRADSRRDALIRLTDDIRDLSDPAEIAFNAARVLGETLGVSRAGYGVIDADAETITIERDWNAPGIKSLAGTLQFRDYGSYIEDLKRGETVVFADAEKDPRTQATAGALKAISAQSVVNMPVTTLGDFAGLLYLNHETARVWPEDDLALIREVAERTHTAVERARSQAELEDLNANLQREVIERSAVGGQYWQISPDLLCVLKADGYLRSFNPTWELKLGYTVDELRATPFSVLLHPDDVERTLTRFADLVAGNSIPRFENRYLKKDGSFIWIAWAAAPYGDAYFCAGRDISEEKAAEAERDRLWTLSEDMLARADYGGGMTAVNPAWTQVLGWTETELLTNPYADIIHPDNVPTVVAALTEMGETGQPTRFENRILTKAGVWKPIGWTVSPEPNSNHFIAIGRDLTDYKAREAELLAAQEALRQSQKMEAVGQLTGGIAHDFNNMLAVVMGSLELMNRRVTPDDTRGKRYIEAALDGAKRAANLTQRLLAFSRQQPLRPEPLDANKLVSGMSDLLRHSIGSDIRLETVLAGGLWRIHADPNQLESVILNLGVNARDAMPDGGKLTIETQNAHLDSRYVASEMGVPAGQYVLIAVTDTGTGMAPDVIAKAFDPFFTTKAVGKGTGLGLSQVYGFVKQSGGHVKIYSEPGQGTSVKIYLPRGGDSHPDVKGTEGDGTMLTTGDREVILVVDDEPAVRQFSADALDELGYRVLEAESAAAALVLLRNHPDIDMLFTDIVMPDSNGRKLADAAMQLRPGLKVLYTTGYTRNAVVHNGIVDKGVHLIGKPFTIDDLAVKVRELLDAG